MRKMIDVKKFSIYVSFFIINSTSLLSIDAYWEKLELDIYPPTRISFGISTIGLDKVLIFGGYSNRLLNDTWIFDLSDREWKEIEFEIQPEPRHKHKLVRLSKTKVLLFGGHGHTTRFLNDTWIFDLDSMKWSKVFTENTPLGRDGFCLSQISVNKVLMFGGNTSENIHVQEPWLYDFINNSWTLLGQKSEHLPRSREGGMMCQLSEYRILLFGGWQYEILNDTWIFDYHSPKYENFNQIYPNKTPLIYNSSITKLNNNTILLFGGNNPESGDGMYDGTWILDINNKEWEYLDFSIKPDERWLHELVNVDENTVLLFGYQRDTWLFHYNLNSIKDSEAKVFKILNFGKSIEIEYSKNELFDIDIKIYDLLGRNRLNKCKPKIFHDRIILDKSLLPSGFYFLVVFSGKTKYCKPINIRN